VTNIRNTAVTSFNKRETALRCESITLFWWRCCVPQYLQIFWWFKISDFDIDDWSRSGTSRKLESDLQGLLNKNLSQTQKELVELIEQQFRDNYMR